MRWNFIYLLSKCELTKQVAARLALGYGDHLCTTPCHILSMFPALTRLRSLLASGHGLTVRHYRNGTEVAPSIDQDLSYDFNFQQYRSVTPRKIMPVSAILERQNHRYLHYIL